MLKETMKGLLPPDLPEVTRWRLVVFASIIVLGLVVISGYGAFAFLGLDGFAHSEDLDKVKDNMKEVRIQLIEQGVFEAKDSECTAANSYAERFFQRRVLELSRAYFEVVGTPMVIPPCKGRLP